MTTIAQHIDEALVQLRAQPAAQPITRPGANRDFAIAITHLETARMFSNRGFAQLISGSPGNSDLQPGP